MRRTASSQILRPPQAKPPLFSAGGALHWSVYTVVRSALSFHPFPPIRPPVPSLWPDTEVRWTSYVWKEAPTAPLLTSSTLSWEWVSTDSISTMWNPHAMSLRACNGQPLGLSNFLVSIRVSNNFFFTCKKSVSCPNKRACVFLTPSCWDCPISESGHFLLMGTEEKSLFALIWDLGRLNLKPCAILNANTPTL